MEPSGTIQEHHPELLRLHVVMHGHRVAKLLPPHPELFMLRSPWIAPKKGFKVCYSGSMETICNVVD